MYARPQFFDDYLIDFTGNTTQYIHPSILKNYSDFLAYVKDVSAGTADNTVLNPSGAHTSTSPGSGLSAFYDFDRALPAPGYYKDTLRWTYIPAGSMFHSPRQTMDVEYFVMQKTVLVVQQEVNLFSTPVVNNSTLLSDIQTDFKIICSGSRGIELGVSTFIEYLDTVTHQWMPAILGVDYTTTSGINTDFTLKFVRVAQFRFTATGTGYNSYNNPFGTINFNSNVRTLISQNYDVFTFYVTTSDPNSGGPPTAPVVEIKLPTMTPSLTATIELNTSPFTTYPNVVITIVPVINYSSGIWKIGGVVQTISNGQWVQEINRACNISTVVVDSNNVQPFTPLQGFGQQTFSIPSAGEYTIKYITTIK